MASAGENARENGDDTHSKNPPVLSREKPPVQVESPNKNMPNNRSAVKGKKRKREMPKRAKSSKKSKRKCSKFSRSYTSSESDESSSSSKSSSTSVSSNVSAEESMTSANRTVVNGVCCISGL